MQVNARAVDPQRAAQAVAELAAIEGLGAHLTERAADALIEGNRPWSWVVGGVRYDVEDTDDPAAPLVLVRYSDGARFEVDVAVSVDRLPERVQ